MTDRTARRKVKRGINKLDEQGPPGWRYRVDPVDISLTSYRYCVLGQVYGDYRDGLIALQIRFPGKLGFLPKSQDGRVKLTRAWRNALREESTVCAPVNYARAETLAKYYQITVEEFFESHHGYLELLVSMGDQRAIEYKRDRDLAVSA